MNVKWIAMIVWTSSVVEATYDRCRMNAELISTQNLPLFDCYASEFDRDSLELCKPRLQFAFDGPCNLWILCRYGENKNHLWKSHSKLIKISTCSFANNSSNEIRVLKFFLNSQETINKQKIINSTANLPSNHLDGNVKPESASMSIIEKRIISKLSNVKSTIPEYHVSKKEIIVRNELAFTYQISQLPPTKDNNFHMYICSWDSSVILVEKIVRKNLFFWKSKLILFNNSVISEQILAFDDILAFWCNKESKNVWLFVNKSSFFEKLAKERKTRNQGINYLIKLYFHGTLQAVTSNITLSTSKSRNVLICWSSFDNKSVYLLANAANEYTVIKICTQNSSTQEIQLPVIDTVHYWIPFSTNSALVVDKMRSNVYVLNFFTGQITFIKNKTFLKRIMKSDAIQTGLGVFRSVHSVEGKFIRKRRDYNVRGKQSLQMLSTNYKIAYSSECRRRVIRSVKEIQEEIVKIKNETLSISEEESQNGVDKQRITKNENESSPAPSLLDIKPPKESSHAFNSIIFFSLSLSIFGLVGVVIFVRRCVRCPHGQEGVDLDPRAPKVSTPPLVLYGVTPDNEMASPLASPSHSPSKDTLNDMDSVCNTPGSEYAPMSPIPTPLYGNQLEFTPITPFSTPVSIREAFCCPDETDNEDLT